MRLDCIYVSRSINRRRESSRTVDFYRREVLTSKYRHLLPEQQIEQIFISVNLFFFIDIIV